MSNPSSGSDPPRPRPVTVAGVIAVSTCALVVLLAFNTQTQLRSVEVRRSVVDTLKNYGWGEMVSVEDVLTVMRVIVLLSAGLAAAGLVLAVYSLRRNRAARVGLSIVAVCLLFTATLVTGPLPLLVAYAAARLWRRDARDWFDGRTPTHGD